MIFLYNICQLVLLVALAPLWALVCLLPKYRTRILGRLGIGLKASLSGVSGSPRIWVHALSWGEVSSSMPLVRALRKRYPSATLIFSATTRSGAERARSLTGVVDVLVPFPLDLFFVVRWFMRLVRPDIFLLVETDFWPNLLFALRRKRIPVLLVNGRVSEDSFRCYQRFIFFFRPMFLAFSAMAVQSVEDRKRMLALGVPDGKALVLGNLKYDCMDAVATPPRHPVIPGNKQCWVAGSTHAGEETMLFALHQRLIDRFGHFLLVVAPRDVGRANEVLQCSESHGLVSCFSSRGLAKDASVLILDRLGELLPAYAHGEFAFVGGSLVDEGGHNPLEPAALGKPVFFGPFMHDFPDIVRDVQSEFPEALVQDPEELLCRAAWLMEHAEERVAVGRRLRKLVSERSGVVERYLDLIGKLDAETATHD